MNIVFDINVILDVLLARDPFGQEAVLLINAVEQSNLIGYLSADSITTIFYLLNKTKNKKYANKHIKLLFELFEIIPVNRHVLEDALNNDFNDFEDSVIYQSAISANAHGIVTRNYKDFKKSKITIYSPKELLTVIDYSGN